MSEINNDNDPFAEFGQSFADIETAKKNILSDKDTDINNFQKLMSEYLTDNLTGDTESLLRLEKLYYEIYIDKIKSIKTQRTEFENYLSLYFMKILVDNDIADWKVVKNPFSNDNYNLAIEFDSENWSAGGYATELYENEITHGRKFLSKKLNEYLKK